MSATEKLFLGELAILLRLRLAKFSDSPKTIAQLINRLIVVPKDRVSFQDIGLSAVEMCSEISTALQEKNMYISLQGVELDNNLQPVFSFQIEISDEELKLNLVYLIKISKTIFKTKKINFVFDSALSKSYVCQHLADIFSLSQILVEFKKS
jgi:hypothetical protein